MNKILKVAGLFLGVFILLLVLAAVLLVTLVNPNKLKPLLTEQVAKYTGRELVIDGDMSWTFFPYLGVKMGHTTLSNPAGFADKKFAEFSRATVGVKVMPLLRNHIESSGVTFDGIRLHLVKNKAGATNWNFQPAATSSNTSPAAAAPTRKVNVLGLMVSGLHITNAAIDYIDEQTQQSYTMRSFDLQAKDISLLRPFPLKASFDFTANKPAVSSHITLNGNIALNIAAQVFSFRDLDFVADIKQNSKAFRLSVAGDVIANLQQQTLEWINFKGNVANVTLLGKINVKNLNSNPVAIGHLQLQPFDLKAALQAMGTPVENLQVAEDVLGAFDFTAGANSIKAQGELSIDAIRAANVAVTHINTKINYQDGMLNLVPITANFYQGTLTGQATVNLKSAAPQINLHTKLTNVQAQPLMEDLGSKTQKIKIAGIGNIELQVTTTGADAKVLLQNLNGTSQFNFKNGVLLGIDLGYLVDSAYALVKGQTAGATNHEQTNFGTITGTATIHNGVISNNDLAADTPRFAIKGAGTINLVSEKIDYALQTSIKQRADQKDNAMNLYGIVLPIMITGNLQDPSVRLDTAALGKAVAQQQIKKVTEDAKQKLQEQIKQKLPPDLLKGNAGKILNNLLGN